MVNKTSDETIDKVYGESQRRKLNEKVKKLEKP